MFYNKILHINLWFQSINLFCSHKLSLVFPFSSKFLGATAIVWCHIVYSECFDLSPIFTILLQCCHNLYVFILITHLFQVFFTRNGSNIGVRRVEMPESGFYPSVGMLSVNEKVRVNLRPLTG